MLAELLRWGQSPERAVRDAMVHPDWSRVTWPTHLSSTYSTRAVLYFDLDTVRSDIDIVVPTLEGDLLVLYSERVARRSSKQL